MTRDPVAVGRANGTLARVAFHLQQLGDAQAHALSDAQADAIAEHLIVEYGTTTGEERAVDILRPRVEPAAPDNFTRLVSGIFPSGRRIKGQGRKLRTKDLIVPPRKRASDARLAKEAQVRAAARTRRRRVAAVLAEIREPRPRVAALLSLGLKVPAIARLLGVTAQAVEKQKYKISRG
jgi:hypothetical protein